MLYDMADLPRFVCLKLRYESLSTSLTGISEIDQCFVPLVLLRGPRDAPPPVLPFRNTSHWPLSPRQRRWVPLMNARRRAGGFMHAVFGTMSQPHHTANRQTP